MTARVLAFPAQQPAASTPLRLVHSPRADSRGPDGAGGSPFTARRRYSLSDMIRLCGLDEYERRTAIDHLRLYARQNGLPLPRNVRVHRGRTITGPDAIGSRSMWDALAVDAWLDNPQPPQGGGAVSRPANDRCPPLPAPRRADMADRARQLAGAGR